MLNHLMRSFLNPSPGVGAHGRQRFTIHTTSWIDTLFCSSYSREEYCCLSSNTKSMRGAQDEIDCRRTFLVYLNAHLSRFQTPHGPWHIPILSSHHSFHTSTSTKTRTMVTAMAAKKPQTKHPAKSHTNIPYMHHGACHLSQKCQSH